MAAARTWAVDTMAAGDSTAVEVEEHSVVAVDVVVVSRMQVVDR